MAALPADERAHAVILTNDYSEASPLVLLGTGLPPVYSGHNAYWDWGPPPADRTVVVHVGDWRPADWSQFFTGCRDVAHIDNGLGIQNASRGSRLRLHRPARAVVRDVAGAADDLVVVGAATSGAAIAKGRVRPPGPSSPVALSS